MTEIEEQELNQKLAEWAGFTRNEPTKENPVVATFKHPDGHDMWSPLPDFTHSLDACFEWLVPELGNKYACSFWQKDSGKWIVQFEKDLEGEVAGTQAETPALALCKAIERLIDKEEV